MDSNEHTVRIGEEAPAASAGRRLGSHTVTGSLGAGGMGEVLSARDPRLRREVAVKVLRDPGNAQDALRFLIEAQVTGQLEHPSIVPVHALGESAAGEPFFTMTRVRGSELSEAMAGMSLARKLEVFLKVCDAIAYAHSRGVIHRDLKPANIMVGAHGEVLVMDWGLAKVLGAEDPREPLSLDRSEDASPMETLDGSIVGTPAYMPPEQARGDVSSLDRRADVYALGAVLYSLLSGRAPYEGATAWAVLDRVLEGPPPPLREAPWELAAVVSKAMAAERARRYPDVGALRADIEAFLDGRLLSAGRYGQWARLARWVRRRPTAATALGLVAVAAALGLAGWSAHAASAERARLRDLAARGEIDRLVGELGGRRRAARDAALEEFAARHAVLEERVENPRARAAAIGADDLRRYARAFDRLVDAHRLRPREIPVGAQDFFLRGMLRLMLEEVEGALADLDRALALDPNHGAALYNRGALLGQRGEYRRALGDLEAARRLMPDHLDTQVNLAMAWSGLGEAETALRLLDGVVRAASRSAVAHACRATVRLQAGDREGAREDAKRAVRLDPQLARGQLVQGVVDRAFGKAEAALSRMDRAIELDPSYVQAYLERGAARLEAGLLDGAFADFERARALAPREPLALRGRGLVHKARGDEKAALADFEAALALDPQLVSVWAERGRMHHEAGRDARARADLDRALGIDPTHQGARVVRAKVRRAAGDLSGARADLDRALAARPGDAVALNERGLVRAAEGDLRGAVGDYTAALAVDGKLVEALVNRASAHRALGDGRSALADLNAAIGLAPREPLAYFNRGNLWLAARQDRRAIADYDRALALDPTLGRALSNRGSAKSRLGDAAGALRDFDAAIGLGFRRWQTYASRGSALGTLGRKAEALASFDEAIRLAPASQREALRSVRRRLARGSR